MTTQCGRPVAARNSSKLREQELEEQRAVGETHVHEIHDGIFTRMIQNAHRFLDQRPLITASERNRT
jgi:hypothetical protein